MPVLQITKCLLLLLFFFHPCAISAKYSFEPSNTYVVIVGVLSWEGPLAQFETKNRKDKELYQVLKNNGVPEDNMVLILDENAKLNNIRNAVTQILQKSKENSTFLFYYAGHGMKEESGVYFANYDVDLHYPVKTGLAVKELGQMVNQLFKGDTVIFFADCCFSGGLVKAGEVIAKNKKQVLVLTSADTSVVSTENWTYTQALIDCFSGSPLADRNDDGVINIAEISQEVEDAMKYRENQRYGFEVWNLEENAIVQNTKNSFRKNFSGNLCIGDYVSAQYDYQNYSARVINIKNNEAICEFYFYSDKKYVTIPINKIKKIQFKSYSKGQKIKVLSQGVYYKAKILEVKNDFYLVRYDDYSQEWDEWILACHIMKDDSNIIKAENFLPDSNYKVEVEWESTWYPAEILKEENGKYFIHYIGYETSWDEWVTKERVRFK